MTKSATKKALETGKIAAGIVSAHTLKIARPLFWHIGAMNNGVPRGATAFVFQFEKQYIAVTADHVIQDYLDDLAADARMVCQLGLARVWPEKAIVARNAKLDIATFEITEEVIAKMGGEVVDCRGRWPPPPIQEGDTLTLTGFLDNHREKLGPQHYEMLAWGGHGIAESITDREILTTYNPETMHQISSTLQKPPLGFNMSGCSGGPVVLDKEINGIFQWRLIGLIYKGPDGKAEGNLADFDRIHIRRLHFVQPDGTINSPDPEGW